MIISRTPLRVSFFGGGTDYPPYYRREKGLIVGCAIDKYVYVSVNKNSEFFDYKTRISYRQTELINNVDDIQHPSVKACLQYLELEDGLDINIFTDVPARTGLGSSSSFTVGLLNALFALKGVFQSPQELGELACHIEQDIIGERVGSQDQFHAAFGGFNSISFESKGITVLPVQISTHNRALLEKSWLMFYTGLSRYADPVLEEQVKKTAEKKNDESLRKMMSMAETAMEIMAGSSAENFIVDIGRFLDDAWQIKKGLSSQVSNELIDRYYQKALKAGAIGGKLSGAGAGGFLSFIVPLERQDEVRRALSDLRELPVRISDAGSRIIYTA